ncbi:MULTISPECIES: glucuronate isomerase [unclassified Rathayibacter]|uniref:glucuronate isomerase n=1 Tax=unclassified Rathayibacter TaxID=2609250 RepID=UPI000CE732D2|nr:MULTISPECIES: glucuronate isomerase [unclassified Rathayibacter]PPG81918.1 glucuronate isomerase [Rathayibacter sp. AY1E5]PPH33449.1 glucuronate isomerase [Rathayibacter sp. AY1C3]PPH58041.1 glucuronate isomerase [Rathayibacter sp. AY1D7]PPI31879.1 glucuronate isomerase [Rathayibacter sp. AY1B4]
MPTKLLNDPDRLLPIDPTTRAIARDLHASVADLPILSPHGHVDPRLLLEDRPFADAAELFLRHDHYVTRLLHSAGIDLGDLGIPGGERLAGPEEVWRTFCAHWRIFAGTASGYWLQSILAEQFGITEQPDASTADALFAAIGARLASDAFRPRALFERFGIEVLATTDDPLDDLAVHRALAEDPAFPGRVLPTFRPDAYLDPSTPGWPERVAALAAATGTKESSFPGFLEALRARRRYFLDHGAVSADHGVLEPLTVDLDPAEAQSLFARARAGTIDAEGSRVLAAHLLLQSARMSVDDGLVMTVHAGVLRNHDRPTFERFGPDTGHDIPVATRFAEPLRPLLQELGNAPGFHLVLFGIDESTHSRELAPLAGYYPSVFLGAPWWFLDAPDAVLRFRAAVTETAGFSRSSGFIDDTRAFLSIPARHDMARRLDAAFLARLVAEGRIDSETASAVILDLVDAQPRKVFKL